MNAKNIKILIDKNIDEAFDVLDDIFGETNGTYNEFNNEYSNPPNNFSLAKFRSRLKRFVQVKKAFINGVNKNEKPDNFPPKYTKKEEDHQEKKLVSKAAIQALVANSKPMEAIKKLLEATRQNGQDDLHMNLILLSAQGNSNEDDYIKGMIDRDTYRRSKTRISFAIISYLNDYQ